MMEALKVIEVPYILPEIDVKEELRTMMGQLLEAHRLRYEPDAIERIARDIYWAIDQL